MKEDMTTAALRVLRTLSIDKGDGVELVSKAIEADLDAMALPVQLTRSASAAAVAIGEAAGPVPVALVMASDVSRLVSGLSAAIRDWSRERPMPGLSPSVSLGFALAIIAEVDRINFSRVAAELGMHNVDWGKLAREVSEGTITEAARILMGEVDRETFPGARNVTESTMAEDGEVDLDLLRGEARKALRELRGEKVESN